jgi:hypothetical protein
MRRPTVMLTTTLNYDKTARLAVAFSNMNCKVAMLCPPGHWIRFVPQVGQVRYHALRPVRSLSMAIHALRPDFIIPCDDRAVQHLHRLHGDTSEPAIRATIEFSLGPVESFPYADARLDLLLLAKRQGVSIPDVQPVHSVADLRMWGDRQAFPWVLKTDGSWGGKGVRIVNSPAEAEKAFWKLNRPVDTLTVIGQAFLWLNFFWFAPWLARTRPSISVQSYITGTPANCAVAAWKGEVLAGVAVEAIVTETTTGPATVIRVVEGAAMLDAAGRMIRALRMTGLIGFDFVIEQATGQPYMIEMNPRTVPLCHLAFGENHDLAQALVKQLTGETRTLRAPIPRSDLIAHFPGIWQHDPTSPLLGQCYLDVPWDAPELLRALLQPESRLRQFTRRSGRRARQWCQQLAWSVSGLQKKRKTPPLTGDIALSAPNKVQPVRDGEIPLGS